MSTGTIKIADHDGVYVIKMEGDVRLTLCLSFDDFIEDMFKDPSFCSVVFDLTKAQAIDSTTLGLMAKISINSKERGFDEPIVISNNPNVTRILVSMGFDDIFNIVKNSSLAVDMNSANELAEANASESQIKDKVLESHKLLMSLNSENQETFKELVETLEQSK